MLSNPERARILAVWHLLEIAKATEDRAIECLKLRLRLPEHAPTKQRTYDAKRVALDLAFDLRHPQNHCQITGTPSLGEVPSVEARVLWLLSRFWRVTRRKGQPVQGL